jgi:hypothetical protein
MIQMHITSQHYWYCLESYAQICVWSIYRHIRFR